MGDTEAKISEEGCVTSKQISDTFVFDSKINARTSLGYYNLMIKGIKSRNDSR